MRYAKYICKRCGHGEPTKWYDYITVPIKSLIFWNGVVFIIIIIGALYFLQNPYVLLEVGDFINEFDHEEILMNYRAYGSNNELRALALNITHDCRNESSVYKFERCYTKKIYNYTKGLDYGLGAERNYKIYDPMETIETGVADCKGNSYVATSLMSQVGLNARVKCNSKHCFSIVKYRDGEVFVIDGVYEIYGYWDDYKEFYD